MPYALKPISETIPESKPFAVADIEAADWTNFLVIGHYEGKGDPLYFYTIRDYLFHTMHADDIPDTIICHFGGIYDFLFLLRAAFSEPSLKVLNMVPRGSGLLCFDLSDGERTITFTDSSAFLPFGLRTLCESFKVAHPKLEIDYTKIKKVTPRLLKYLEHDLKGLYEVVEKYREWPLIARAGAKMTMASQALQVLRIFLPQDILPLKDNHDTFIRTSYFGGRTEIFKPYYESTGRETLYCYDVNSLYPTVMLQNEFPNRVERVTRKYIGDRMGFYRVKVRVPKHLKIPPLGTVQKMPDNSDKFIFATGEFWGCWSTIELEYAKTLGVEILEVDRGIVFKSGGFIFKEYIEELYAIRLKAKKDGNTVDDIIAKLLMNSCYGRFGLNKDRENLVVDTWGADVSDVYSELETDFGTVRLVLQEKRLDDSFSNVAVAAWVTSLARIYMHKIYMQCGDELYYTDTDSIFTTKVFPTSNELGGLKLEYKSKSACFLLPKTYVIEDILNWTEWKATYHDRKPSRRHPGLFTVWRKPIMVDAKFKLPLNASLDDILDSMADADFADKTGFDIPCFEDFRLVKRGRSRYVRLRGRGVLKLELSHKKVVMKGFDKKKISHFKFEDFVTCLEGQLRVKKSARRFDTRRLLRATMDPRISTLKSALRKNKVVMMSPALTRQIRSKYDKRRIIRSKKGFTSKPLHIIS